MGYCMRTIDSSVVIKAEDKDAALEAVRGLMTQTGKMSGRSMTTPHFAFVNLAKPDEWESLEDALVDWRWEPTVAENGDITALTFIGEKYGDEDHLFKVLRPFIGSGSFISMMGEDGETWDFLV